MKECVIEARGVLKRYHDVIALNCADITVRRGEIYGLIGDNGAGKTTFLKLLNGQIFADGGMFRLLGAETPKELERVRRRTGAIVESPGFYPKLSVEQNLEYYRIQRGIPGKESVKKTLEMTGMLEHRRKKCANLSMGMKQRLGLSLALLGEPELLILDEPINGLDPSGIIEIRNLLLRLNREKNITIIISSHILSELEQLAMVYGFLSKGNVLEEIAAAKLREMCAGYVEIKVSEPERYTALLEKNLRVEDYKILADGLVRISDQLHPIEAYSELALADGIKVLGLKQKQMALEEYYMNLKNRGNQGC